MVFYAFTGNYGKRILRAFKMTGITSEFDLLCLHQLGEDFKEYLSNTEDLCENYNQDINFNYLTNPFNYDFKI